MLLITDIAAMEEEMTACRRDLHAHPELGFEENRTADKESNYKHPIGCGCRVRGCVRRAIRFRYLIVAAMSALILLLGNGVLLAQENDTPRPAEEEQASSNPDEQNEPDSYPAQEREFGDVTDIEGDLNNSLPKLDSVLPQLKPQGWADFKTQLYNKYGLKLGFSYQGIKQVASESLTEQDTAAAGWVLLQVKWEAFRRGKDYQGSIVMSFDGRHTLGDNAVPGLFRLQTGSLWTTDAAYFEWDPYVATAFWEQWFKKDRFVLRAGSTGVNPRLDFFRFGDFRTSFSNSQLTAPAAVMPFGPPGPGLSFKWWPIEARSCTLSARLPTSTPLSASGTGAG